MHQDCRYPGGPGLNTKYAIIIPDGAADYRIEQLGDKTIFEAADIPNMDQVASEGRQGIVCTIPRGMAAGSDVAQMSILGYDPEKYYTGRAPLEAAAKGIHLSPADWIFRCNLVTFDDNKMADHSAGHISTDEAATLLSDLQEEFSDLPVKLHLGVSYRHLCVISDNDFSKVKTEPPHEILEQKFKKYLPKGKNSDFLLDMLNRSQKIMADHDVNRVRKDLGENPVSSIWLWGQGQRAILDSFRKKYGFKGATITAVDLLRGISKLIHFDLIEVEGATGYANTNYHGKGQAAIKALEDHDIVLVHIEATDEAGHQGNADLKKSSLEQIDKHIVGPVHEALKQYDRYRILVLPDHPTPIETRGHTDQPVPFAMAGTNLSSSQQRPFCEENAFETGLVIEKGHELMEYFLKI